MDDQNSFCEDEIKNLVENRTNTISIEFESNKLNLSNKENSSSLKSNENKGFIDTICSMLRIKDSKFVKFVCVGAINTLFGYTMFSLLIKLGLHYQLAVIFGTVLSIMFNFKTIGKLVFNSSDNKLVLRFIMVYCVLAAINILLLDVELKLKINVYIAGAILLLPLGILSFVLNKTLVFKGTYEKN